MMEVYGLCKSLGGRPVVSDAAFTLPDGQWTGLFGPSGAGKTTLARMLCGVLRPDRGKVTLDGVPLWGQRGYDRRAGLAIQLVYQQPHAALDPCQRMEDGFRELISYHRLAPDRQSAAAMTAQALAQVDLEPDILRHLPHQISGGQAQRIALARCLLFRPQVLILDEATSMLDVSTQANVLALVRRSMAHGAVLAISHDRDLLRHVSDRFLLFDEYSHVKESLTL